MAKLVKNKPAPYPRLKNSKRTSKSQFTVLENRKSKRMDRVARRGPLARAPGALKGGHFRNCKHFCRSWRGDPLEKKQIFEKNLTMPKNWKGNPWDFKHPICCKISKKLKGGPFGEKKILEKSLTMPKNWKGGGLWGFSTSILTQNSKKIEGGKFLFSEKKSHSAEKNWKGGRFGIFQHPLWRKTAKKLKGDPLRKKIFRKETLAVPKQIERGDPLVSPGMACYAEKQEKPFWFSWLGQMVQFGAIIFCRTFKN